MSEVRAEFSANSVSKHSNSDMCQHCKQREREREREGERRRKVKRKRKRQRKDKEKQKEKDEGTMHGPR